MVTGHLGETFCSMLFKEVGWLCRKRGRVSGLRVIVHREDLVTRPGQLAWSPVGDCSRAVAPDGGVCGELHLTGVPVCILTPPLHLTSWYILTQVCFLDVH